MKKSLFYLVLLSFLFSCQKEEFFEKELASEEPIQQINSKADINDLIVQALKEGRFFKWDELNTDDLWRAIELSDYKVNIFWSMDATSSKESEEIESIILKEEKLILKSDSPILEVSKTLNYLTSEIKNKKTLISLIKSGKVEYIEPLYEVVSEQEYIESVKQYASNFDSKDQQAPSINKGVFNAPSNPSFINSGIDVAWDRGYDGKGITVGVIDNGPQKSHPLFGEGKTSNRITNKITGETFVRTIDKQGFFKDNPFAFWKDWDGNYETGPSPTATHSTAMLNHVGGAPNNLHYSDNGNQFWGTGVAYGANLVSVRSSRSVFIGLLSSRIGVKKAFEYMLEKPDVKIISMSQGLVFWDEGIARAIRENKKRGKLIFCAGGTFPGIVFEGLNIVFEDFNKSSITLFPAKMQEVISVTGITSSYTWCENCFGNADFVTEFSGDKSSSDGGSSSVSTISLAGMAALIWGTNANMTSDDVFNTLKSLSENPSNRHPNFGHGKIDMTKFNAPIVKQRFVSIMGSNNRFVSSENGSRAITCNRSARGPWEKFEIIELSDGKIALKGNNGRFVSSENGSRRMTCNRSSIGSWEKFEIVELPDGKIALKGNNGRFISSENGKRPMVCNRSSIGSWEKFQLRTIN